MKPDDGIRTGFSTKSDAADAVDEVFDQTEQPDAKLTVFFCSSHFDLDAMGAQIRKHQRAGVLIGCTTAGEIGPDGYTDRSIRAFSLGGPSFDADQIAEVNVGRLTEDEVKSLFVPMEERLRKKGTKATRGNTFGIHLVDSWLRHEEIAMSNLSNAIASTSTTIDDIKLMGGSAADNFQFGRTPLYFNGTFNPDGAVFVMISTSRPFSLFQIQGCVATNKKFVVTAADTEKRIVKELNGRVAADEYADAVGVRREDLSVEVFAMNPLVTSTSLFARDILAVNEDGSLLFACAIAEGLVLTVGGNENVAEGLRAHLEKQREKFGDPALVVCCDAAYRRIVAQKSGCEDAVNELFRTYNVVGFRTFGEQFGSIHCTHTLTGVAIGRE